MIIRKSEPRTRTKRSLLGVIAIIAATVAGMIALTGPAFATQRCGPAFASIVCLEIQKLSDGNYAVHVGIDYHISLQAAQEIIDQPGDPFFTVAMSGSTTLFFIPLTQLGASADGLGAGFDVTVLPSQLGGRTVFARMKLTDNRSGIRFFDTFTLSPPY
jgi:hypothetical protein